VAEAHLITAVRGRFRRDHPVPIYLLAASAREILTTIGARQNVRTMLHGIAESTGHKLGRVVEAAHEYTNFFKHADKDTTASIDFDENSVDAVIMVACSDFARIAKGMPIELQVFQAWWLAINMERVSTAPLRIQPVIRYAISLFPGVRRADLLERLNIGQRALEKAEADPRFRMEINREVRMSEESERATASRTPRG